MAPQRRLPKLDGRRRGLQLEGAVGSSFSDVLNWVPDRSRFVAGGRGFGSDFGGVVASVELVGLTGLLRTQAGVPVLLEVSRACSLPFGTHGAPRGAS